MYIQRETSTVLVVVNDTPVKSTLLGTVLKVILLFLAFMLYDLIKPLLHPLVLWEYLLPMALAVVLVVYSPKQRTQFIFNAIERTVRWRQRSYLKTISGTFSFDEVSDIQIETNTSAKSGEMRTLSIVTPQGRFLIASNRSGIGNFRMVRRRILEFVKGPGAAGTEAEEAELMRSIRSLLAEGRKIDAIKLYRTSEGAGLYEAKRQIDAMQAEM